MHVLSLEMVSYSTNQTTVFYSHCTSYLVSASDIHV